jgi:hypothetical protein
MKWPMPHCCGGAAGLRPGGAGSANSVLAMNPEETFETPEQLQRYEKLINDLRCVVCQNQSVAESQVNWPGTCAASPAT